MRFARSLANGWPLLRRRLWLWADTGDIADEEPFGVLYRIRDGKVVSWNQTYGSMTDAIDAIPAG